MTLQTRRLRSIEQVRAFVEGNEAVDYGHRDRESAYGFVGELLGRLRYRTLGKRDKGIVRRFLAKATGISAVPMDRLIRQWRESGRIEDRRGGNCGRPFERRYTGVDIRLLAEVDEAFGQMSGLATCELLRRQHEVFGDERFERLAGISNSHVYNLRAVEDIRDQAHGVDEDACGDGGHRAAPGAGPAGEAGAPARGHGPPGRPERREGPVPGQPR